MMLAPMYYCQFSKFCRHFKIQILHLTAILTAVFQEIMHHFGPTLLLFLCLENETAMACFSYHHRSLKWHPWLAVHTYVLCLYPLTVNLILGFSKILRSFHKYLNLAALRTLEISAQNLYDDLRSVFWA